MSITVTDIVTQYGAYYENAGQNRGRLLGVPFRKSTTLGIPGIRHINTEDTVYRLANPIYQSILQQYQKAFTAKGGVDFHPNEIRLRRLKIDDSFYPSDIVETWLGWLAGDSSRNQEEWPLVRWLFEEYYANQIAEDKELLAVYKGVYEAPTAGTAGEGGKVFDGLRKQLQDGAADSDYPINVVTGINTLTPAPCFDQIEAFDEAISDQFESTRLIICVSPAMARAYRKARRDSGIYTIQLGQEPNTKIDFTEHTLIGLPSMIGTTDIFATLPENIIHLMKFRDTPDNIDLQKDKREICCLLDWMEAVGFGVNKLVWTTTESITDAAAGGNEGGGN